MNNISVKFLGNATVKLNNQEIYFPYKKAEGLFYYICLNKKVSREEVINIFWIDNDETSAKKNLRDAIYKIKKTLGENIFCSGSKSTIELNTEIDFLIDVDNINSNNVLGLYTGHFLENFTIKNCYEFESWMEAKREDFKNIYLKSVTKKVHELVNVGDFKSIQKYGNILIDNDPYNEKTYRDIMRIYALCGDYNKAIKLYYNLVDLLKKDLYIEPENSTKLMFKEILKLKDSSVVNTNSFDYFYGRYDELYTLSNNFNNFLLNSGISILISGEAGIGKTALINKHVQSLDNNKYIILKSRCYSAEEDFFLKPWHSIFSVLSNYTKSEKIKLSSSQEQIISYIFPEFNRDINDTKFDNTERIDTTRYEIAVEAILILFEKISYKKKIILIFDDMQWMDKMSKILLSNILSRFGNNNVIAIGAYRDDFENKLSSFVIPLINSELLTEIKLHRFSLPETSTIVSEFVPTLEATNSLLDDIYKDTEGNALFLIELLKVVKEKGYSKELSSKATNIIKSRIIDLNKNEKILLNSISLFFDKVSIENLKIIVHFDDLNIFDIIESLQEKRLIQEIITDKDIFYSFTHQRIREYIYAHQSEGKKKLLHEKIALYFEGKYKTSCNAYLYPNLIYHFEKCGNIHKSLKYKVKNLTDYYTIYHETYPLMAYDLNFVGDVSNLFDVEEKLAEILNQLDKLDKSDTEFLKLKMEVSYLSGRYFISIGEYKKGLESIGLSMRIADELENNIYLLNNFKQMIFYSIQVYDMTTMHKYINKSLALLEKNDNIEERATIFRLKGLYFIKTKNYSKAIKFLNESLNIFLNLNQIKNRYTLSIAACYNYLGQMYKYMEKYETAYDYFTKSIELCLSNSVSKGLSTFYSNAGQVLYEMHRYSEAEDLIAKSLAVFAKNNETWGRDIAEGYAALLEIKNKNMKKAKMHYETANDLARKLNNPKSINLAERVKNLL